MLDPRIILWMGVAQVFSTKASASMVSTHWAEETAEAGEENPARAARRTVMIEKGGKKWWMRWLKGSGETLGQTSRSRDR